MHPGVKLLMWMFDLIPNMVVGLLKHIGGNHSKLS